MKSILVLNATINIENSLSDYFYKNKYNTNYRLVFFDKKNGSKTSCSNLRYYYFDNIIDFSDSTIEEFENTFSCLNFNKYIFISSSAVDAIPFQNVSPQDYEIAAYAMRKKECEDFIIKNIKNYNILRPCYIVGDGDYTNRFTKKDGKYYWKDSGSEMTSFIEVESLSKIILDSFESKDSWVKNPCV
jgi:hypothetical protein